MNVVLPSIQRGLDVAATTVQWEVSGYALAFAVALVPAGRLGDLGGRRRMFLIGLIRGPNQLTPFAHEWCHGLPVGRLSLVRRSSRRDS